MNLTGDEPKERRWRATAAGAWSAAVAVALLAAAAWLAEPAVRYLAIGGLATVAALPGLRALQRRGRGWAIAAVLLLGAFWLAAADAQRDLRRIEAGWPAYRAALAARGERAVAATLDSAVSALRRASAAALAVPDDRARAFEALESLVPGGHGGVVVLRDGAPWAWAGARVVPVGDPAPAGIRARLTTFYATLEARADSGGRTAIASLIVDAREPADRLTSALDEQLTARYGLVDVLFAEPGRAADARTFQAGGVPLLDYRAIVPGQATARLERLSLARAVGGVLLTLGLLIFLLAQWRAAHGVAGRLAPIALALACVAVVPLNLLSSLTPLFDPAVYFAPLGGPFTASAGALMLSSALVLLAMFVVLRTRLRARTPWLPLLVVLAIVTGGPFLLRRLSAGINAPPGGLSTAMWLAWEVALFLAAGALLLGAASAGSTLLGARRGLPAAVAPVLAAAAALLAPVVLQADARWPEWYTGLWIAAIGALALTRRHRTVVLAAATVAALGATTLAWRADVRGRVMLANRDVTGLGQDRPELRISLLRLGDELATGAPPTDAGLLLRAFARSDLDGTGYPVAMATTGPSGDTLATMALARLVPDEGSLAMLRSLAIASGRPEVEVIPGAIGRYHALAVPFADGSLTTVLVAPRTRLLREEPHNALLGVMPAERGAPPYALTLAAAEAPGARPGGGAWSRERDELHGDRIIQTSAGPARAHIEVDLRSYDVLLQRGTLVVLLDLALLLGLWALSVWPEGGFRRWLLHRRRQWTRSFRLRLTVALFAFFIVPAVAFAAWSYRQLQASDRQSRELLVRETLRALEPTGNPEAAAEVPLLVYRNGALAATSDPLLADLAPAGQLLDRAIVRRLTMDGEVEAAAERPVGARDVLFGYRAVPLGEGLRLVVAAPAVGNEEALDQRRRDLGVLVAFFTVVGALAALWLSGIAARTLATPIGRLRDAALSIAGGDLEPELPDRPPAEFVPVFSAFRRMGRDLTESRAELEAAQRRTAAVLRNVASAVVAVSHEGVVTIANPRAAALLDREPAAGEPIGVAAGGALAARVVAFLAATAEEEEFDLEREGRQLHGRLTRLSRGGAVLTLDDVTEMARAQRVLAWGEMARQVAHEIKNPLTPIRLGVQHLRRAHADRRGDFEAILQNNVERILAEIDRLDEIARGFSRYGMAPADRQAAEPTDVAAVVRDVVELERMGGARDGIAWQTRGAEQPVAAAARDEELREVLINLLENSRLAAAQRVEIRVAAADGRVVVEVEDDGEGIAAELMPRIFEPHFSTRTSGSGLGLAISRQLIEGWGGTIGIRSAPGQGTVVRIELRAA